MLFMLFMVNPLFLPLMQKIFVLHPKGLRRSLATLTYLFTLP